MKFKNLIALVLLVLIVSLAVSASIATSNPLMIGIAMSDIDSEYWLSNYNAMLAEAKKHDAKTVTVVANGDVDRQLQQIENLIAQKVSAIVCASIDGKAIVSAVKKCNAAGIPFLANSRVPDPDPNAKVAFTYKIDNYKMARIEAQYMADYAKKSGKKLKILEMVGNLGDEGAVLRHKALMDVVAANKERMEVVASIPTEWKQELALAGTVNSLQAHPEINAVFSPSDFLLPSVLSGMEQQGKLFKYTDKRHLFYVSFDGSENALDKLKEGWIDAVMVEDSFLAAKVLIDNAVKLAKGEKLEKDYVELVGFLVTRENFKEKAYDAWGYVNRKKPQ